MKRETKYTETEQNEMNRNEIYQNEMKRNEIYQSETERNETKRNVHKNWKGMQFNETKIPKRNKTEYVETYVSFRFGKFRYVSFRFVPFRYISFRV
jgi:hypothetical protein